jgi:hypothetical protein
MVCYRDPENLTLYFGWEVSTIEDTKSTVKFCHNQKHTSVVENNMDGEFKIYTGVAFVWNVGCDWILFLSVFPLQVNM